MVCERGLCYTWQRIDGKPESISDFDFNRPGVQVATTDHTRRIRVGWRELV
jgi:hypothetical protein